MAKTVTYRDWSLKNVGISWYATRGKVVEHWVGSSLAAAKAWVRSQEFASVV